jgi:hypothetical protein
MRNDPMTALRSRFRAFVVAAAMVAATAACGDATGPKFPSMAGSYHISGSFNDFAASLASLEGTLTFNQASTKDSVLTGTANVTVRITTSTSTITQVKTALVSSAGQVTFQLVPANPTSTWKFTGTLSGNTITGTHSLESTGSAPFAGVFAASRLAQ